MIESTHYTTIELMFSPLCYTSLLPCFYIYGREVHVGDTLSGIDPNFIAAQITNRLHNNYIHYHTKQFENQTSRLLIWASTGKMVINGQNKFINHIPSAYYLY
ncbi:hypothetical protein FUT12_26780 [Bacillus mycoides]|nr:hypothetical protein [Bacillus mycoides]